MILDYLYENNVALSNSTNKKKNKNEKKIN